MAKHYGRAKDEADWRRRLDLAHQRPGHVRRHAMPGLRYPDGRLEVQPAIERNLDGIADRPRLQPPQHVFTEKGPIHAKSDANRPAKPLRQVRPDVAQERHPGVPVMDVAGAGRAQPWSNDAGETCVVVAPSCYNAACSPMTRSSGARLCACELTTRRASAVGRAFPLCGGGPLC